MTDQPDGVSEIIGAILLISVVSVAVAIIAVGLVSTPPPIKVPHVNFLAVNESGNVILIHNGGDTLNPDEFFIRLDQGQVLDPLQGDVQVSGGWPWSLGKRLTSDKLNGTYPSRIDIIYRGGGTDVLMDSISVSEVSPGSDPDIPYPTPTPLPAPGPDSFIDYIIRENVFVYGNRLYLNGNSVNGPGATVIITGNLNTDDLNGGASVSVTTIYVDGPVNLEGGSASLGSSSTPGSLYVNGDLSLWNGARHVYDDIFVAGNFRLKDARIHRNVYVDGNLELGWTPWLADESRIYYTGTISYPGNYDSQILAKCIHVASLPGFYMPNLTIPPVKSADWYASRGYVPGGTLTSNLKIFADSYTSSQYVPTAQDAIIVASNGDITVTGLGGNGVTGVLFAPKGRITFDGAFFRGIVISRDGFYVTRGGTQVSYQKLTEFISSNDDYPF